MLTVFTFTTFLVLAQPPLTIDVRKPGAHLPQVRRIVQDLPASSSLNRVTLLNKDGVSLDSLLQSASRDFLELKNTLAWQKTEAAFDLIASTPPYAEMRNDLMEIIALQMMIAEELPDYQHTSKVTSFNQDPLFLEKLPFRIQQKIKNTDKVSVQIDSPIFKDRAARLWINGAKVTIPLRRPQGKYFSQWISEQGILYAGLLNLEDAHPKVEILWRKNLWDSTPDVSLHKLMRRANLPENSIMIVPSGEASTKSIRLPWLIREDPIPQSLQQRETIEIKAPEPFWENPWFWAAVGTVVAGTSAYLIYESQQPKVIRTQ